MEMDDDSSNLLEIIEGPSNSQDSNRQLSEPSPPQAKGRVRRFIELSPPHPKGSSRGRGRGSARGRTTDISQARLDLLCDIAAEIQNAEEEVLQSIEPLPDLDEDVIPEGGLFNSSKEAGTLKVLTNFEEIIILDIYHSMEPIYSASRGRGMPPKISLLDSLFLILMLYRNAFHMNAMAAMLHIKLTTLRDTITRIRPILLQTLETRWKNKDRPQVLEGVLQHAAIAVDSTSFEVYRPHGRFEEAKIYFDGKNRIYALKKEVVVKIKPPNYALYYHKATIGSYIR